MSVSRGMFTDMLALAPSYPALPCLDGRCVVAQLYRSNETFSCWTVFFLPSHECVVRRLRWDLGCSPRHPDREPLIYAADARLPVHTVRAQLSRCPTLQLPTASASPSGSGPFAVSGVVLITDLTRIEVSWVSEAPEGLLELASWFASSRDLLESYLPAYTDTIRGTSFRIPAST